MKEAIHHWGAHISGKFINQGNAADVLGASSQRLAIHQESKQT